MSETRRAGLSVRPSGGLSLQAQERSDKTQAKPAAERSDRRRAVVMLIQRGDPEIAGALMAGVLAGRAEALKDSPGVAERRGTSSDPGEAGATFPTRGRLLENDTHPAESLEIYTVEQDKWRRVARQVHVAIGNTKTPEDYCHLIVKARGDYAIHTRSGPLHTFAGKLLLAWALIWQGIWSAYDAQDRVLRP